MKKAVFVVLTFIIVLVFVEGSTRVMFYLSGTSRSEESRKFKEFAKGRKEIEKAPAHCCNYPYLPYIPRCNQRINSYTNSKSFRGFEFDEKKDKNTFRIFCLGGSTTYGINHPVEKTYPFLLQKKMNEEYGDKKGLKFEVINTGDISWNSLELMINLAVRCLQYNPDLFIYYEAINDCTPSFLDYEKKVQFCEDYTHYRARLKGICNLTVFDKFPEMLDYSALYTLIRWRCLKGTRFMGISKSTPSVTEKYVPVYEEKNFVSLKVAERNLKSIVGMTCAHKIPLMFVTQYFETMQTKPGKMEKNCGLWNYPALYDKIKKIYNIQKSLAAQNPEYVYYIDIVDDMKPYWKEFHDAVHLTPRGNELLVEAMSKKIVPIIDKIIEEKYLCKEEIYK